MTYNEVIEFLYKSTPQFQVIGAAAYKPGLETIKELAVRFGNPHKNYPIIHVAGTNGKGSVSHSIAAILMQAGYKTGLFTSPHLVDFRERIRVNGRMIEKEKVCSWMDRYEVLAEGLSPSFFELTTIMALEYFSDQGVDVAVVEVGLGGRLDSTNIVEPIVSIITNISKDHVAQLGNSLKSIASEKAGIIKPHVPVILGEGDLNEVRNVIVEKANEKQSSIIIASDRPLYTSFEINDKPGESMILRGTPYGDIECGLTGLHQVKNANTVLHAIELLRAKGWNIDEKAIKEGYTKVVELTHLQGRWELVNVNPTMVCDTGHNEGGWVYLKERLEEIKKPLRIIIGFVNDKDVDAILKMLPKDATYYFTQASIPRALPVESLCEKAEKYELKGRGFSKVSEAVSAALKDADENDFIFVGGSTFVVADLLNSFKQK